eukprot:scaffold98222_cov35-Cyclotella_meneghiniana.AAC.2
MLAFPATFTRSQVLGGLSFKHLKNQYSIKLSTIAHNRVGGATSSTWRFGILVRHDEGWISPPLPRSNLPDSRIINMIDDKIGGGFRSPPSRAWLTLRNSDDLGWDLGARPDKTEYWVRCPSVFSPKAPIIRPMALHELSALWDFLLPGNDELPAVLRSKLLISFLHGPPGKMLRNFSRGTLRYLWSFFEDHVKGDKSDTRFIDYKLIEVEDMGIKAIHLKATKADDAPVDFEMWAWPNESELETLSRNLLRLACFSFWKLNLLREALRWLKTSPDSLPSERLINQLAIIDCITRSSNSTFWDWDDGSRLFFWRWEQWWKSARDGEILFHECDPPRWMGRNLPAPSPHYETLLRKKEGKLVHRRYLEFGFVDSIVPRFGVPKGDDDIRLVWDATRCGANETLWAPSFWMPVFRTIQDLIIKRLPCSVTDYFLGNIPVSPSNSDWRIPHQSDMDVGEMFLNYLLHHSERHFFGARIVTGEGDGEVCQIMRFSRLLFGGRPCPYLAVQGHARAIELITGNIADASNPLGWTQVITNWPFDFGYDPSMPRVIRVRRDGEMAPGYPAFVDDGRISGVSKEICDSATHRFCTKVNYLGEQNASRKRRPASTTPGAWTGKMLWTHESHPIKGILPEKWSKQRDAR